MQRSFINSADRPLCLLVEDSDEDADTVSEAFRVSGVPGQLRRVTNGDECLALLRVVQATRPPALILMDLNMPGTDGREVLRQIKDDATLKIIPVVVTSTSADPRDLTFCYRAGANAYHVKPIRHAHHCGAMIVLLQYWLGAVVSPTSAMLSP